METRELEVWKPIPNYEGIYEVSSWGNIRRLEKAKNNSVIFLSIKLLKINYTGDYPQICLCSSGRKKIFRIHRIIDKLFLKGDLENYVVNHIDGNKFNNYYKNLERVFRRENTSHYFKGKDKTSIYTGVSYDKSKPKYPWVGSFWFESKCIKIGNFVTEEEAYEAYLNALKEYGLENKYATESQ